MKSWILAGALALVAGAAAASDPAEGLWKTEPGDTGGYLHVQIASCGDALCGTIAKAFDGNGAAQGSYEHLGKQMLWDMKAKNNGAYGGGKIWAPDADKTYRSKMKLSGNSLKVEGCVAVICRGQTWSRIN